MKDAIQVYDVRCQIGDSAFLIDDGNTAILCDSGFGFTGYALAENIRKILGERKLDYIFLTHSHYDHALGSACVRKVYPEVKTVAGRYAASVFQRPGARKVMEELDRKAAAAYGAGEYNYPWDALQVDIPCDDGDVIRAGDMEFEAVDLPGHTKCSVGFYCRKEKFLIATETLGVFCGEEGVVPAFLVGYEMTLRSMERVKGMEIERILSPHYGLLSREQSTVYLDSMIPQAKRWAEEILSALRAGKTEAEILTDFREKYWVGYVRKFYPINAAMLNTSIMIRLIRDEFGVGRETEKENRL